MKTSCWATIASNGSIQVRKGKPTVNVDEVAVYLTFNLPDSLFRKPRLVAEINIPESAGISELITSDVAENVQELVQQATGLQFRVTVENPEQ